MVMWLCKKQFPFPVASFVIEHSLFVLQYVFKTLAPRLAKLLKDKQGE
jgi:hypothetical protein